MTQPTTARLDLSIWRNDDVYEFPIRVIGPNLTGVAMRAQIRASEDSPFLLAALDLVTNGNAEGVRLAGATNVDGRWVNDVRVRLNKSTRQKLPYGAQLGSAWIGKWVFAIAGITRLIGDVRVLAHALDSEAAPLKRPKSYDSYFTNSIVAQPDAGATLTIAADSVVELLIDGADLVGRQVAEAAGYAAEAADHLSNFPDYYVGMSGGLVPTLPFNSVRNNTVPADVTLIQTTGTASGLLRADATATAADLARYPNSITPDQTGRMFARVKTSPLVTELGSRPDGTDQIAIWREAIDWCTEKGINELVVPNVGSDPGFYFSDTLHIDNAITIRGTGTGRSGANRSKSVMRFAEGKSGIIVHTAATSPRSGQTGGDGSRILGLKLIGGQNDFAAATACIQLRARAEIGQVIGEYFGDGLLMRVAAGSGGATEGNVNLSKMHDTSFAAGRRHAVNIGLGDANCISVTDSEGIGFNGYGINGANFLSCYFENFHTVQNGTFAGRRGGTFAAVNYAIGGQYYFFVADAYASPAQLVANAPTLANNTYWIKVYAQANPGYPIWGTGDMNYAPGGPYMIAGPGKAQTLYSESDQPPSQVKGVGWIDSGTHAAGVVGNGLYTTSRFGMLESARGFVSNDDASGRNVSFGENGPAAGNIFGWYDAAGFSAGAKFAQGLNVAEFRHGNADGDIYRWLRMYGPNHPTAPMYLQLLKAMFSGPGYADNTAAANANMPVRGIYMRPDGALAARI